MSGKNKEKINYCIYCGAEIESGKIYCPKCGKLNKNLKSREVVNSKKEKKEFQRTCPGCGSIISSNVLLQCPICNTLLEKIPEKMRTPPQENIGYIFDWSKSKKLQPELNKEKWNIKEGIQVFEFTILLYFLILTSIYLFFFPSESNLQVNFLILLIELIPGSILGLYPIFYIINKKNKFIKLGFDSNIKKFIYAVLIGIFGGIILFIFNSLSDIIFSLFSNYGFQEFVKYNQSLLDRQVVIQNLGPWIFVYILILIISTISIEIAFRGVLHKSLKEKFGNSIYSRLIVILIVALVYGVVESLFLSFVFIFISLFLFIYYFLLFIIIGMLFEINGNIYNTLIANILFNILTIIAMLYF